MWTLRNVSALIGVLFLTFSASTAFGDNIQFVINTSFHAHFDSPNDNFWGYYYFDPQGVSYSGTGAGSGTLQNITTFQNVSFVLPADTVVTAAQMIVTAHASVTGTGHLFATPGIYAGGPIDPSLPSVAPTWRDPATSWFWLDPCYSLCPGPPIGIPTFTQNVVSTGTFDIGFLGYGWVSSDLATPGYNQRGWIAGYGDAEYPYTVTVDVSYDRVPEPASLVLIAIGMGVARLRFANNRSN